MSQTTEAKKKKVRADKAWQDLLKHRRSLLNVHLPKQHSQVDLIRQLQQKIQSPHAFLDQMFSYLDSKSGMDWLDVATYVHYANFFSFDSKYPISRLARLIRAALASQGHRDPPFLEVVALGCGSGAAECQLVQTLLDVMSSTKGFILYLFDINPVLLEYALKHANYSFLNENRVAPMCVLGNMYDLNSYQDLFFSREQKDIPRLITLLGATVGNITDEMEFLQHSLGSFASGTLLLMDYTLRFAPPDQPSLIMEKDPYFAKDGTNRPMRVFERFDLGPIRRYKETNIKRLASRPALEMHRVQIPGSYHIEIYADVLLDNDHSHRYGVGRVKRYESEQFINAVEATGWEAVGGHRFTTNREIYLFRKK